jgi:hypothetical protein
VTQPVAEPPTRIDDKEIAIPKIIHGQRPFCAPADQTNNIRETSFKCWSAVEALLLTITDCSGSHPVVAILLTFKDRSGLHHLYTMMEKHHKHVN